VKIRTKRSEARFFALVRRRSAASHVYSDGPLCHFLIGFAMSVPPHGTSSLNRRRQVAAVAARAFENSSSSQQLAR
jgi:hypothetical protein